jgi:hypothetical protein
MTEYNVFQKAEIWYLTKIEANSKEEAIELAKDENNSDWEPDFETAVFFEEYEVYEH